MNIFYGAPYNFPLCSNLVSCSAGQSTLSSLAGMPGLAILMALLWFCLVSVAWRLGSPAPSPANPRDFPPCDGLL